VTAVLLFFCLECPVEEQQLLWFGSRQLEPDRQLSSCATAVLLTIFCLECPLEEQQLLWFGSRQLEPDRQLSSYVGSNEKSKVIIRLTAPTANQPPGRSQMDPATRQYIDKVQVSERFRPILL
jgi:hypothetical protein